MAILNMFAGSGGGVRIPLEAPTLLTLAPQDKKILITWTDPVDKVASPGGEAVATWNYTIVVRKIGSAPQTPGDGVEIVREKTRNQYQSTAYVDELYVDNDITYYYSVFAVSTIGVWSEPATSSATPTAASPEFYMSKTYTPANYHNAAVASTQNHFIIAGGNERYNSNPKDGNVTTFDASLTKGSLASYLNTELTPGKFNGYALFICGSKQLGDGIAYSPSLTRRYLDIPNDRYDEKVYSVGLGSSENYVLFAGGWNSSDYPVNTVSGLNTSFTQVNPDDLSYETTGPAGTHVGDYIIFAGGTLNYSNQRSFAYSNSLTKIEGLPAVSAYYEAHSSAGYPGTASTGNYAFFGGGKSGSSNDNSVTIFDQNLTKQPNSYLNSTGRFAAGGEVNGFAMFMVIPPSSTPQATCFDNSLTRLSDIGTISPTYSDHELASGSGTVGNVILFASGDDYESAIYAYHSV